MQRVSWVTCRKLLSIIYSISLHWCQLGQMIMSDYGHGQCYFDNLAWDHWHKWIYLIWKFRTSTSHSSKSLRWGRIKTPGQFGPIRYQWRQEWVQFQPRLLNLSDLCHGPSAWEINLAMSNREVQNAPKRMSRIESDVDKVSTFALRNNARSLIVQQFNINDSHQGQSYLSYQPLIVVKL